MLLPGQVLLITGIMAAGKSTVAQAVAERLPKSVHLRGDIFRRMIVNGRAAIEPGMSDEAWKQLCLRYQLAVSAAEGYCAAGFAVVYQDVILGESLAEVVNLFKACPVHVIVLCPTPEAAGERDKTRHKVTYNGWTPHELDASLRTETPHLGLWLDTTALSVTETVDKIFARWDETTII